MDFPEVRKESLRLRRKRRIHFPLIREAFYQCLYSSLPLEETPLLGEMSQTEGSAVSGEEKVSAKLTDEVFFANLRSEMHWIISAIAFLSMRQKPGFAMV